MSAELFLELEKIVGVDTMTRLCTEYLAMYGCLPVSSSSSSSVVSSCSASPARMDVEEEEEEAETPSWGGSEKEKDEGEEGEEEEENTSEKEQGSTLKQTTLTQFFIPKRASFHSHESTEEDGSEYWASDRDEEQ